MYLADAGLHDVLEVGVIAEQRAVDGDHHVLAKWGLLASICGLSFVNRYVKCSADWWTDTVTTLLPSWILPTLMAKYNVGIVGTRTVKSA